MTKRSPRLSDPWRSREESSLWLGAVLRLVDALRRPLGAFGVDYPIFRKLLRARVLMDLRSTSAEGQGVGMARSALTVLMTWFVGLMMGLAALVEKEARLWPVVSLSALLCLVVFYLLQALVGMLVDPGDVKVLAPHPVPDRTLFAVRLAQVFAYLALMAAGFVAGNLMLAVFGQPLVPTLLVFPVLAMLCTLTALGAVALFFMLLLRVVGPASFQRVSLWMQVVSGVVFMLVAQMGGRLVPEETMEAWWGSRSAWKLLWPPVACTRAFELAAGEVNAGNLLGLACTLLVPALAFYATLSLASHSYQAALEGTLELGRRSGAGWPHGVFSRLGARAARKLSQRAGFDFALALSRREAHVLRAALPQFVSFQIMAIAIGMNPIAGTASGYFLALSAGLVAVVLPGLLELCQGSPTPEARWIFQAAPLEEEAELLRGGVKGLVLSWYALSLLAVGLVQLVVVGPGELPRIVLALELSAIVALSYARLFSLGVPFTRDIKKAEAFTNLGLTMTMFVALALVGAVHWALSLHPFALWAGVLGGALAILLLWRGLDSMPVSVERRLVPPREPRA